jgi:hypothetical protein
MPVTNEVIRQALLDIGFPENGICLVDNMYSLPDEHYISRLSSRFSDFIFNSGLTYATNRFDCDKFALAGKFLTELDQSMSNLETGLAFGFCGLITEGSWSGHSICLAVLKDKSDKLVVKFYEPQPIKPSNICLTEVPRSHIASLWWCYL